MFILLVTANLTLAFVFVNVVYVVLGVLVTIKAANGPGGTLWLLGPAFLLGGIGMLGRAQRRCTTTS